MLSIARASREDSATMPLRRRSRVSWSQATSSWRRLDAFPSTVVNGVRKLWLNSPGGEPWTARGSEARPLSFLSTRREGRPAGAAGPLVPRGGWRTCPSAGGENGADTVRPGDRFGQQAMVVLK